MTMAFTYDIVGPATAISINGQAGLGFNFYAAQRWGNGTVGGIDASVPTLNLYIFTIPGINAMIIPAFPENIKPTDVTLYDGLLSMCPSPGAYWLHDHDPDPRDVVTWYRSDILGLPNVGNYPWNQSMRPGPPGKYPYPTGWNEWCAG
jgi:hypothetical protein